MAKEYLGVNAVNDLFDIIDENYVSKEDLEKRDKEISSAICAGSALIAQCLLKVAGAILIAQGAEGGGEDMESILIATDSEVNSVIDKYFSGNSETSIAENPLSESDTTTADSLNIATQKETDDLLNNYFN